MVRFSFSKKRLEGENALYLMRAPLSSFPHARGPFWGIYGKFKFDAYFYHSFVLHLLLISLISFCAKISVLLSVMTKHVKPP